MRICYLSNSVIPSRFANSVHVMRMCDAFTSLGHDTNLLCVNGSSDTSDADIFEDYATKNNFTIQRHYWNSLLAHSRLGAMNLAISALTLKPDLVYSRDVSSSFFLSFFDFPHILELHCPIKSLSQIEQFFIRKISNKPNRTGFVVISHALKDIVKQEISNRSIPVLVAPDAADEQVCNRTTPKITSGKSNVIYLGHLYPGRGIEMMLLVAEKCKWANFHFVGGMDSSVANYKKLSFDQKNVFFHGFVTPSLTREWLNSADICVAPYQEEVSILGKGNTATWMSPLKIFEYMSSGKPIIASNLPAITEILTNKKNAMLVAPNMVDQWVDALHFLNKDKTVCQKIGRQALTDFKKKYTWQKRASKILREYSYLFGSQ